MAVPGSPYKQIEATAKSNDGRSGFKIGCGVYINSTDITNNRTHITIKSFLAKGYTGIQWSDQITYKPRMYTKLNGTSRTTTYITDFGSTSSYAWVEFGSWSGYVNHNADGTATMNASSVFEDGGYGYGYILKNTTVVIPTFSLPTIPRASTPSVSNTTPKLGENITISTNRASTAFTHDLSYTCNGVTGIISNSSSVSKNWEIPYETLIDHIPTSYAILSISCKTKNGSQIIGTKSISIKVYIPTITETSPKILNQEINDTEENIVEKFGFFISGKSRIKINSTAVAGRGATVKTINSSYAEQTLNSLVAEFIATGYGKQNISQSVTDSRNKITTLSSKPFEVEKYEKPLISKFITYRCDSQGNQLDTGTRVKIEFGFDIVALRNLNDKGYKIEATADDKIWIELISGSEYSLSDNFITPSIFDTSYGYKIKITVSDYFNSNISITSQLPVGSTIWNMRANGKGFAFGKVSEKNGFEVAEDWNSDFHGNVNVNGEFTIKGAPITINPFPVGSIYMSISKTNPSSLFGGTWKAWGAGRVPVGVDTSQSEFSTVQKTGGHKSLQAHKHTISIASGGSHSHYVNNVRNPGSGSGAYFESWSGGSGSRSHYTSSAGSHSHSATIGSTGSGDAQNLQPYITCYMWLRTE